MTILNLAKIPTALREHGNICLLLQKLEQISKSLYLTGSWARETYSSVSDIDIDIIILEDVAKKFLQEQIQTYQTKEIDIDAKIFTSAEFNKLQQGPSHFFYWTRFQGAIHLGGEPISLVHDFAQTRRFVEIGMDRINEAISLVQSRRYLTTALFLIYESLCNSYFLESYLLKKKKNHSNKESYLRTYLKDLYLLSRQNYYSHTREQFQQFFDWPITISFRDHMQLKKKESSILEDRLKEIDSHVMSIYSRALRMIDNSI